MRPFISYTAKNRPGLIEETQLVIRSEGVMLRLNLPCVSSDTKRNVVQRRGSGLMFDTLSFTTSHFVKSQGVESVWIFIQSLKRMDEDCGYSESNVCLQIPHHDEPCMLKRQLSYQLEPLFHLKM